MGISVFVFPSVWYACFGSCASPHIAREVDILHDVGDSWKPISLSHLSPEVARCHPVRGSPRTRVLGSLRTKSELSSHQMAPAGVVAHSSSWTPAAYERDTGERARYAPLGMAVPTGQRATRRPSSSPVSFRLNRITLGVTLRTYRMDVLLRWCGRIDVTTAFTAYTDVLSLKSTQLSSNTSTRGEQLLTAFVFHHTCAGCDSFGRHSARFQGV